MTYKTPGVYVDEISTFPPSVIEVETAIPAFIGYTEKAKHEVDDDLHLVPYRIENMLEYQQYFGGPDVEKGIKATYTETKDDKGVVIKTEAVATWDTTKKSKYILYYSMQLYFANGGGPCYIVSVGKYSDAQDIGDNTKGVLGGLAKLEKEDEPTLILCPEAVYLNDKIYDFQTAAMEQAGKLKDRFVICDVLEKKSDGTTKNLTEVQNDFRGGIGNNNLKYGAAYFPFLKTSLNIEYDPVNVLIEKVSVSAAPAVPAGGAAGGGAPGGGAAGGGAAGGGAALTLKDFAASNSPGGNLVISAIKDLLMILPPGPAMAGVYAYVDSTRGVWKAPANVSLNRVKDVTENLTSEEQQNFNVSDTGKSINAIRPFAGKGILVWGARTLDGASNEWRYINVRRFFNMVEESVQKSTIWAVFEPNTKNTWVKAKGMIENYLITKWIDGALAGAKPEDAFYVRIGLGLTMSADDINNGIMNVEIGMAVSRPAEFIILKFSHKLQVS